MCGCESSFVSVSSFVRVAAAPPNGGGGGRRGSCRAHERAYLCSFRIICSRMAWSGFLLLLLSLLSPPPATMDGGEDWALRGMFIVVPSGIRGERGTRPKLCRFGQLDAVRRRWKEAGTPRSRLRTDTVRLMRVEAKRGGVKEGYARHVSQGHKFCMQFSVFECVLSASGNNNAGRRKTSLGRLRLEKKRRPKVQTGSLFPS